MEGKWPYFATLESLGLDWTGDSEDGLISDSLFPRDTGFNRTLLADTVLDESEAGAPRQVDQLDP